MYNIENLAHFSQKYRAEELKKQSIKNKYRLRIYYRPTVELAVVK